MRGRPGTARASRDAAAAVVTRRKILRTGAGALLAAGLWPTRFGRAEPAGGGFSFFVLNDLHYIDAECGAWCRNLVARMKSAATSAGLAPEFCLLVGDLSDNGTAEQLAGVRDAFAGLGMPVRAVIGNHDHAAPAGRQPYEDLFPDSLNYAFEHRGWQFVGLDCSDGQSWDRVTARPDVFRWMDSRLPALDRGRPTVLFTHFPLGAGNPDRLTNADAVLERFKPLNLRAVFNGHYHGFTEARVRGASVTTNACCARNRFNHDGTLRKGYFLCEARDGAVTRRFVEVRAGVGNSNDEIRNSNQIPIPKFQ